jgi:outer membrane protein OmpA-like peptidoglycan-associated protein
LFPSRLAVLALASALAFPALALAQDQPQPAGTPQDTRPSAQQPSPAAQPINTPKEGFWGRMNPFASKKWVHKQTDPVNDRLTELDGLSAQNARDIKDVDDRSRTGIHQAQSTADAANMTANAASTQAQEADGMAQNASGHVDQLNTTVNGLDQYHQINEADVAFRGGQPILSAAARKQLDDLAEAVNGHQGYILEMEAHSPAAGSIGIQNSERLAEAVKRYLVTEHEIPVYRLHSVALGNAMSTATGIGDQDTKPVKQVRTSSVHIRLMENSLAAQEAPSPHDEVSSSGAERP